MTISILRIWKIFNKITWLMLHPLILSTLIVCCYTFFAFPEEDTKTILSRGVRASQQVIMFSIVDGMVDILHTLFQNIVKRNKQIVFL